MNIFTMARVRRAFSVLLLIAVGGTLGSDPAAATGVAVAARGDGIVVAVSVGNGVDVGAVVGDGVMVGSFVGDGAVVAKGRGVAVVALSSVGRLTVAGGRPSSAWIR